MGTMRKAVFKAGVGRGVWVAQWAGENWETILVAVRRDGRRLAERTLKAGEDHIGAADELWAMLDEADPGPMLKVI